MEMVFKILLSLITLFVMIASFIKLQSEHNVQKELIKKINDKNRKKKSVFDIFTYINERMYIKGPEWVYQKNRGKNPCDLKRRIKVKDYSDNCDFIVCKKGL